MKQLEQTIAFNEAKQMLQMIDDRTLKSFINQNSIKVVTKAESGLSEILLDKKDFIKVLGVEELPEKFLTIHDASIILRLSEAHIKNLCKNDNLPFYLLGKGKGSRLLFIESELLGCGKEIYLERSSKFYVRTWKYDFFEEFFQSMLQELQSKKPNFERRSISVLNELICSNKTIEQISEEYYLSEARVRQIFDNGVKKSRIFFKQLLETNKKLLAEQANLKQQIRNFGKEPDVLTANNSYDYFAVKLNEFGFSTRALNCLSVFDIDTVGELLQFSYSDILNIRNMGKNTVDEIQGVLAKSNLKLKDN